jgi:uncharacterized membrane protein
VPSDPHGSRRVYLDWSRGVAVLLMIVAHTADAWTRAADRQSAAFSWTLVLGGFAAPLFLWLAGLAVALSVARLAETRDSRAAAVRTICKRGLEIFILAFLFRLQAFIVSPGGPPITIFRVDILNVMGPAMVAVGLLWAIGASTGARSALYAAAATAIALVTPLIRTAAWVNELPLWFQWYLRPAGDLTTFTLFPWAGFVFAGAACGVLLSPSGDMRTEPRLQSAFAAVGVILVALGFYTSMRPSIYAQSNFWSSSPTWFAIRSGILMIGVAGFYGIGVAADRWNFRLRPLERFGRRSLFVYWIHVELVYGYASWPLRRHLPLWGALAACAAFSLLMYGAVVARDRIVQNWRARPRSRSAPEAATA